jgi:methylthioribose-1-phosphate isomerase
MMAEKVVDGAEAAGLQAIRYQRGRLEVLDQLGLPHGFEYEDVRDCETAFDCIKAMRVRGQSLLVASGGECFEAAGATDLMSSLGVPHG